MTTVHALERPLEAILARENLQRAWRRVKANKGAAGVDAVSVTDFPAWARQHWPTIKQQLLTGNYQPEAVRRVWIPKSNGGQRPLGIPNVADRIIQQAIAQQLAPQQKNVKRFLENRLKLHINVNKSRICTSNELEFLGFCFRGTRIVWSDKALHRFKHRVRQLTGRSWGVSLGYRYRELRLYVMGWMNYFALSEAYRPIPELDEWLRRCLRCCYWRPPWIAGGRAIAGSSGGTKAPWPTKGIVKAHLHTHPSHYSFQGFSPQDRLSFLDANERIRTPLGISVPPLEES